MTPANLQLVKTHAGDDVSDYKIYLDTRLNQYKHMYKCPTCDEKVLCMCWKELGSVFETLEVAPSIYCDRHYMESEFEDTFPEMCAFVDDIIGTNLKASGEKWNAIINELHEPSVEGSAPSCTEADAQKIINETMEVVRSLTDEQVDKIVSNMECDCDDFTGSACDV